jgi:IS6 family transposase
MVSFAPAITVCGLWWYLRYVPELDKRCRLWLNTTSDSYQISETYIKIKKQWYYLSRATNAAGATLDCMPRSTRDVEAVERFFHLVLGARPTTVPRVITVEKNVAYPPHLGRFNRSRCW